MRKVVDIKKIKFLFYIVYEQNKYKPDQTGYKIIKFYWKGDYNLKSILAKVEELINFTNSIHNGGKNHIFIKLFNKREKSL